MIKVTGSIRELSCVSDILFFWNSRSKDGRYTISPETVLFIILEIYNIANWIFVTGSSFFPIYESLSCALYMLIVQLSCRSSHEPHKANAYWEVYLFMLFILMLHSQNKSTEIGWLSALRVEYDVLKRWIWNITLSNSVKFNRTFEGYTRIYRLHCQVRSVIEAGEWSRQQAARKRWLPLTGRHSVIYPTR
jgi:hypothetical protein